jgi:hypothetical protein
MMPKIKSIEFWLFALPALFVVGLLIGLDRTSIARPLTLVFGVAWVIIAIAWMLREFVRWIRS